MERSSSAKRCARLCLTVLGAWLWLASSAFAFDSGELCGHSRFWSRACEDGERCDIRFRLGWIRLGLCIEEQRDCGGLLGADCEQDEFCDYVPEALCGAADQTGVCRARPEVCTKEYRPVCGCDDRTYGNRCVANAAGVSVAAEGPCLTPGACSADSECPHGACTEVVGAGGRCTVCGDGSEITCTSEPAPCLVDGQVREVRGGCFGRCVDRGSCRPTHCEYAGYVYPIGSAFYGEHSCNTCSCGSEGQVVCSVSDCPCGSTAGLTWLPLSPQECQSEEIACPAEDTEWFTSFCGCGCVSRTYLIDDGS